LLLTSLRPVPGDAGARAVAARFLETAGFGGSAALTFGRTPTSASAIDGEGTVAHPLTVADGGIPLEFSANEAFRVRAEWA
ncbi:MAG: hypothetical protein ACRC7O_14120, partial [Fimbriiglobus sp.]